MRFLFGLIALLFALPVLAQTGTGPIYYSGLNIANSITSSATGLTRGMSNGSVREALFEFDDSSSAPNTITTALTAHLALVGPTNGDKVAAVANTYNCCVSSGGFILGFDAVAMGDVGSSQTVLAGMQLEVNSQGAQNRRYGLEISIDPGSSTQGQAMDAAIAIDNLSTSGAPWANVMTIGDPEGVAGPLGGGANVIHINSPMTIANFCDCGLLTATNYLLNFVNFQVGGNGVVNSVGGYKYQGTAGVNCAAGSVNLTTMVVQGGIITHC